MAELDKGVLNAFKLVKNRGVIVANAMHLTQILKMLNALDKNKIDYDIELVIEPSNRLWELRKVLRNRKKNRINQEDTNLVKGDVDVNEALNEVSDYNDEQLNWTCRLEDRFDEKLKRGGLFFNYWSGFLIKLRKV